MVLLLATTARCAWHSQMCTADPSWPWPAPPWAGRSGPRDEFMHHSTELWWEPKQRQELPTVDYHGSTLPPSPPSSRMSLPKQGVISTVHPPLHPAPCELIGLQRYRHSAVHRAGTAEPMHRLHGTYGSSGDGLWIERVQGHLIPVTLPQINQCIWLQVSLPVRLKSVFNAFYISSVATRCLSGCKWLFKDSLPSWQTHFASLQTDVKS